MDDQGQRAEIAEAELADAYQAAVDAEERGRRAGMTEAAAIADELGDSRVANHIRIRAPRAASRGGEVRDA